MKDVTELVRITDSRATTTSLNQTKYKEIKKWQEQHRCSAAKTLS